MTQLRPADLSSNELNEIEARIIQDAETGNHDSVRKQLQPLLHTQRHQQDAAICLLRIVDEGHLLVEDALDVLEQVYDAHPQDPRLLGLMGDALERARDIDMLNSAPPEHSLFANVTNALAQHAATAKGSETEPLLLKGLLTAARMLARQRDDLVESTGRRLIELDPQHGSSHYNFGLFLKTRGRFREGMIANQTAASLADEPVDSYQWNLGICATGAREGAVALQVWKQLGQKIEMGRFDLPEGRYPICKVRLAQRPLAERSADSDDPGLEETIWIERLSPCHGIIRSVLYQDLGINYGDVILIDGAPITYHTYGDKQVPVFPHLATLVRSGYRVFDFAGTQQKKGMIADASADLAGDAVVYSHTENFASFCGSCWRNSTIDHAHDKAVEHYVVKGKIAAPPDLDARELLRLLDAAMSKRAPCRVYSPDLCAAAGQPKRAELERRRFGMMASA